MRKKDYGSPPSNKRQSSAEKKYAEREEGDLPRYLRTHPRTKPPPTKPCDLADLFSLLSLSKTHFPSYRLGRVARALPTCGDTPLPQLVERPAFASPTFKPNLCLPLPYFYMADPTRDHPPHAESNDWRNPRFVAGIPAMVKAGCEMLKEDGSNFSVWEY